MKLFAEWGRALSAGLPAAPKPEEQCPVAPEQVLTALAFGAFGKAKAGGRVWRPDEGSEVVLDADGTGYTVFSGLRGWRFLLNAAQVQEGCFLRDGTALRTKAEPRQGTIDDVVAALGKLGFKESKARGMAQRGMAALGVGNWTLERVVRASLRAR